MKVYPLRMEDSLLSALKEMGIKERKSVRDIILEALQRQIYARASKTQELKERKMLERAAFLASRLSREDIVEAIRQDRGR